MNFEALTPEQQEAYLNFMLLIRPMSGRIANVMLWIETMTTLWVSEIQAIHSLMAANTVIPDNSGYPNSSPLKKSEIDTIFVALAGMINLNTAAFSTVAVKAVGPENVIQGGA